MTQESDKCMVVVHYIIAKCGDPRKLGSTKLNKILWFADSFAYVHWGESITGSKYIRQPYGPVPKNMQDIKEKLMEDGKINMQARNEKYDPVLYFNLKAPDVSIFPDRHVKVLDSIIDEICNEYSANEISKVSHDDIWEAFNNGEEIPLETLLVADSGKYGNEVLSWANKVVKTHGL